MGTNFIGTSRELAIKMKVDTTRAWRVKTGMARPFLFEVENYYGITVGEMINKHRAMESKLKRIEHIARQFTTYNSDIVKIIHEA